MVSFNWLRKYCCEDLATIENYDIAVSSSEKYDCHHRKEDEGFTKKQLIELGLYYKRPSSELILVKRFDHLSKHSKGNNRLVGRKQSAESNLKRSLTLKGRPSPLKGRKLTEEHKRKIGEASKGKTHILTDEMKKNISEAVKKALEGKPPHNVRKVKCVETGMIFNSLLEATKFVNGSSGNISTAVKKNRKAYGYYWEYI